MIRAAQHADGYINSYYTVRGLENRWTNLRDMHEMYCLGHLFECCVAYEELTSSGRLLEPVMKAVRHVHSVFGTGDGQKRGYPGHQEIEIGLLRLYELTKDPLTLEMATYFIKERGAKDADGETYFDREVRARGEDPGDYMTFNMRPVYRWPRDYAYHQADCRLTEATEVKGHSVRAMYYFTAAADLARLTGDGEVKSALDRMWRDVIDTKLYVTGGLGAIHQWEGFGPSYFLGDTEEGGVCYAETCASFGLVTCCQRLLRLDLRSEYADVMELSLYNGFLGAMSQEGDAFYYQNPLRTLTGHPKERNRWFDVACCPPNVAKLLGCLGSLAYTYDSESDTVAVHQYIGSSLNVPGTDTVVSQTTNLPWSGEVQIGVQGNVSLALRIPSWSRNFECSHTGELKNGYLHLPAEQDADITLKFSVEPRKVYANPRTGKNEVCLVRGPLVYCIEDVDNDVDADRVFLSSTDTPKDGGPTEIAGVEGVVPVLMKGQEVHDWPREQLYRTEPWEFGAVKELTFVPYFLRANRGGNGGMRVWSGFIL